MCHKAHDIHTYVHTKSSYVSSNGRSSLKGLGWCIQPREEKIGEEPQRGFDGLMMTDIYKDRKLDAEDVDAAPIYSNNNRNENEV